MRWEYCSTSRPKQGESVSGDAASVFDDETKLLCVVADGLGHGPEAARASEAFVDYVSRARHLSLDEMMLAGSAHIASTRGAAVSLMRIDLDRYGDGVLRVGKLPTFTCTGPRRSTRSPCRGFGPSDSEGAHPGGARY